MCWRGCGVTHLRFSFGEGTSLLSVSTGQVIYNIQYEYRTKCWSKFAVVGKIPVSSSGRVDKMLVS